MKLNLCSILCTFGYNALYVMYTKQIYKKEYYIRDSSSQLNYLVHNKIIETVYISTRLHKYFIKKNLYYLVKFLVSNLEFTENYNKNKVCICS